ncbi:MAG: hypothetical protein OHK0039_12990 [Bacteroidia bacterium]
MKKCYLFILALGLLPPAGVWSQDLSLCQPTVAGLTESIVTTIDQIQTGSLLTLMPGYLEALAAGRYAQTPSGLRRHVYLRPASKQELRRGVVSKNPREQIGADGNVYVAQTCPSELHFFRRADGFESYTPTWQDPDLLLPIGLAAADPHAYAGVVLEVLHKQPDYLVLRAGADEVVFYRGFPAFEEVFQSPSEADALAYRQQQAASMAGRRWLVYDHPYTQARSDEVALTPEHLWNYRQFWIESAEARTDGVLFSGRLPEPATLYLSRERPVLILDRGCVADLRSRMLETQRLATHETSAALAALAADSVSPRHWADLPLADELRRRFVEREETGELHYVFEPEIKPADACFIKAGLNKRGDLWLVSCYAGPEALYHSRIILYPPDGDSVFSRRVSHLDKHYTRIYFPDGIEEEIHFTEAPDLDMVARIALQDSGAFRVRFTAGGSFYHDIDLPELYHDQIRDAWLLAQLLRYEARRPLLNAGDD